MGDFPWRHVRRFIVFLEFLEMRIGNFQERQVEGAECVSLVIPQSINTVQPFSYFIPVIGVLFVEFIGSSG